MQIKNFFKGGPTLTTFLFDEWIQIPLIFGPSSARQRNANKMAFCWRGNNGPLLNAGLAAL